MMLLHHETAPAAARDFPAWLRRLFEATLLAVLLQRPHTSIIERLPAASAIEQFRRGLPDAPERALPESWLRVSGLILIVRSRKRGAPCRLPFGKASSALDLFRFLFASTLPHAARALNCTSSTPFAKRASSSRSFAPPAIASSRATKW